MNNLSIDFLNPNGVFETMRAYQGKVFRRKCHIERLFASAKAIDLKAPHTSLELEKLLKKELRKSRIKEAYVRLALVPQADKKARINLIIKKAKVYPDILYQRGIKLTTAPTKQNYILAQEPKIKSSNFLNAILAKIETSAVNTFEVLLLDKGGLVTEGATSNIFIVKDKILFTPPAYLGLLEGITRDTVIGLARNKKYKVMEIPFTRADIYNADEAFITNSSIEIMPVVWVDGRVISRGGVGKITKELRLAYKNVVKKDISRLI